MIDMETNEGKLTRLLYLHTLEHHACWDEKNTLEEYEQLKQEILEGVNNYQKLKDLTGSDILDVWIKNKAIVEKVKDYALRNNFKELWEILKGDSS